MASPKELFRKDMRNRLGTVSGGEFSAQGERAAALIRASSLWARWSTVFLFLSTNTEIDTGFLLKAALEDGKKVFAPVVGQSSDTSSGRGLSFYPVLSADGPWRTGPFGIREPLSGAGTALPGDFSALIVTPGLAFDAGGNRLGRGGGYYDRFFAELDARGSRFFTLGLCMDFQLVEQVPSGESDKKMNALAAGAKLIMVDDNKGAEHV